MRRSTRVRKREHEHEGTVDGGGNGGDTVEDSRTPPAKAAATKRAKRAVADARASPSPSPSSSLDDEDDDAHGDHDHDSASSGAPEWVLSVFSEEKRAQWDEFLRTKCLARVDADFYDLFELATALSKDKPLDAPQQTPEYVVCTDDSSKCSFRIAGSSLFHVLDLRIQEQLAKSPNDQGLKDLAAKVKQYLRFRKLPSRVTPASLSRKRASQATAASLHKLGIVVPYNAKKQTGFRELPVVGDQLAALLQDVQDGNVKARKTLSGLITRATIANDECDFGTSLLLGLDLFTAGEALEKESLQLLRVAYMLLRRLDFYKMMSAQTTHRRAASISSSSDRNPPHMLTSIVRVPSDDGAQPSNLCGSTQASSSHVADSSQPKIATVSLP